MSSAIGLQQKELLLKLYSGITRWTFFLSLPLCVFLVGARVPLLLLFGNEFVGQGSSVLLILLSGSLFVSVASGAANLLLMSGNQYRELNCMGGGLILNILLNIMLIPAYGVYGAATATTISHVLTVLIRYYFIKRLLNYFIFDRIFLLLCAIGGFACAITYWISVAWEMTPIFQTFSAVILSTLCFCLVVAVGFGKDDNDLIKGIVQRRQLLKNEINNVSCRKKDAIQIIE